MKILETTAQLFLNMKQKNTYFKTLLMLCVAPHTHVRVDIVVGL